MSRTDRGGKNDQAQDQCKNARHDWAAGYRGERGCVNEKMASEA
jgi:hypothetical protein